MGLNVKVSQSSHLGFFDLAYEKEDIKDQYEMILSEDLLPCTGDYAAVMASALCLPYVGAVTGKVTGRSGRIESAGYDIDDTGGRIPRFAHLNRNFSGYKHRADIDQLVDAFDEGCVLLRRKAVKCTDPKIELKEGYRVYYMPKAQFVRKNV